jgi:hypothetical protein
MYLFRSITCMKSKSCCILLNECAYEWRGEEGLGVERKQTQQLRPAVLASVLCAWFCVTEGGRKKNQPTHSSSFPSL